VKRVAEPRPPAAVEMLEEDESPCLSQSSSQHDYNTASSASGCSSPLSEPASSSSERNARRVSRRSIVTATASLGQTNPQTSMSSQYLPTSSAAASGGLNVNRAKTRYGSQGQLLALDSAPIKLSPSSSDYFRRTSQPAPLPQDVVCRSPHANSPTKQGQKGRHSVQHTAPPISNPDKYVSQQRPEVSKSPPKIEKQNSEKSVEKTKKELAQQSNSFDDFIRMAHHAGVSERTASPSKSRSKRGFSVPATEITRRQSEDDIQRVIAAVHTALNGVIVSRRLALLVLLTGLVNGKTPLKHICCSDCSNLLSLNRL